MAKSIKFEIESYKVQLNPSGSQHSSVINLISVNLSHNIRCHATVLFLPKNPYGSHAGQATNVEAKNFDPIKFSIFCDRSTFAGFYQVLSTEKPVSMQVDYEDDPDDPKGTFKFITSAMLFTGTEMPGDFEKPATIIMKPISNPFPK